MTAVLDSVQEALAGGNKVVLTGFGTFEVRQVKQRRVRPITLVLNWTKELAERVPTDQ